LFLFAAITTAWELIPELEHKIVPKPGEAFIYGLYTAPGYRRRCIDSFTVNTRIFWWLNGKMPRLVPAPRANRSSEERVFG